MKASTNLNRRVRNILIEKAPAVTSELDAIEQGEGYFGLLGASMKGRQAWVTYYLYVLGFATFFVALYCLSGYLDAARLEDKLDWALALVACLFVFSLVKIIGFDQIMKLEMLHEVRRLEMRILSLSLREKV